MSRAETDSPRPPRVVVTGIGLVTGLGVGREATWRAIRDGRHAFRFLELPPGAGAAAPFAGGPVPQQDHRPLEHLRLAVAEAFHDARLHERRWNPERAAVVIGMSKGDLGALAAHHHAIRSGAKADLPPWLDAWPDGGARMAMAASGFRGPCLAPVAACATGLIAALRAQAMIVRGDCDLALVGAGDSSLDPLVLNAFRRMGILADVPAGGDPGRAVRPWDRSRSGFLVGEGAAVLVLEREDHAILRSPSVNPYAELAGGAFGGDAHHMTALHPDPAGLAHVLARALANAQVPATQIDHVNVHGTATATNDPLECRAIRQVLGLQADHVACSASKSQIGHLLGAAGAVELALTCLALRDQFVPPTLNLTSPDPDCDLDTVGVGRSHPIRAALKISIGFGGHLAGAVVRGLKG